MQDSTKKSCTWLSTIIILNTHTAIQCTLQLHYITCYINNLYYSILAKAMITSFLLMQISFKMAVIESKISCCKHGTP